MTISERIIEKLCQIKVSQKEFSPTGSDPIKETEEVDRIRAASALASDLRIAEERANREGWIDADDFDREMGIIDRKQN